MYIHVCDCDIIIRYEYKVEDLSTFAKWEEGNSYTRNLVHQGVATNQMNHEMVGLTS